MNLPFACPVHAEILTESGKVWISPRGLEYPNVGGAPWLFPDPKFTLVAWKERAALLLGHLKKEIEDLKVRTGESSSDLTRSRLEQTRALKIKHLEMLKRTLDPLKPQSKLSVEKQQAFGYQLPLRQGLLGYFPNLIRDWSPRFDAENVALFKAAQSHFEKSGGNTVGNTVGNTAATTGTVLILGSGGSRFAYDWAEAFPDSTVIAFDLNPVLLLAAMRLNSGETIRGVETATSPKDPRVPGREVELKCPRGPRPNLHFVFGDVYALPFMTASIDLCITPWLVDILPRRFSDLCSSIAGVVKPNGIWLNTGSFNFDFRDQAENLSVEEAQEIAGRFGWDFSSSGPSEVTRVEIPYLQSEFDAHRRFETVTQFSWRRSQASAPAKPHIDDRVEWLRDPKMKIPNYPEFHERATSLGVMALVLSLADGMRSLEEIAAVIAVEHGLSSSDAQDAAATFFDRFVRDRRFREQL